MGTRIFIYFTAVYFPPIILHDFSHTNLSVSYNHPNCLFITSWGYKELTNNRETPIRLQDKFISIMCFRYFPCANIFR